MKRSVFAFLFPALIISACQSDKKGGGHHRFNEILLSAENRYDSSTTAGNLVTTAMQKVYNLDVVLYPSGLLHKDQFAYVNRNMSPAEIDRAVEIYPPMVQDQFMFGTVSGKSLKEFIFDRVQETYSAELQVAGIRYDIRFLGGVPVLKNFRLESGSPIKDDHYYKIAVSNFFYFNGSVFPGYKYRNGLSFFFTRIGDDFYSARAAVRSYLTDLEELPNLFEPRVNVTRMSKEKVGKLAPSQIQGESHISPYTGHIVETKGVVTAVAVGEWYPRYLDIYIQNLSPDNNPKTSDAIHITLYDESAKIKVGDVIEVTGTVYEEIFGSGLGRTGLRDVTSWKILKQGQALPEPVHVGRSSAQRNIPYEVVSTYKGNVNSKPGLNLNEALDFYESLEGMRIRIENPRVVGFRGGNEEYEGTKPKSYLNLYVLPDGKFNHPQDTPANGVMVEGTEGKYVTEVLSIWTHHMTTGLDEETFFRVGQVIEGEVTGVLGYEKNIFGGGEFAILLPEEQKALSDLSQESGKHDVAFEDRLPTTYQNQPIDERDLSVATFNVENLAANQSKRIQAFADSVKHTLKCPDIINLVEIQDSNGPDFSGRSQAEQTLKVLIEAIDCSEVAPFKVEYRSINIDPILHNEGGQPGGNIRVAMLYNPHRVSFSTRGGGGDPLRGAIVNEEGQLSPNPSRVFPQDEAFNRSRRSLVAQFQFRDEDIYVIGNHFNSKLGDSPLFGANQPATYESDRRRAKIADKINDFVELLINRNPKGHVIVLGDFNAHFVESPMKVLEGEHLKNLINYKDLVPPEERYTTNYNGNSQALDYILTSYSLLQKNPRLDVLHINSDFMKKLSDHDPLVARFRF